MTISTQNSICLTAHLSKYNTQYKTIIELIQINVKTLNQFKVKKLFWEKSLLDIY